VVKVLAIIQAETVALTLAVEAVALMVLQVPAVAALLSSDTNGVKNGNP
jgi:hypothetical protein